MISILMPIYNGIEFIDESVNSIINQTYENWELIIGINGHPQNSEVYNIAKSYENKSNKIRVFDFYELKGKSITLNKMINYCNYNYIALLDVDDIWYNKKLEIQSKLLDKYDIIGSRCIYIGDIIGIVPQIPIEDISSFDFFSVNPIINSSVILRKELCGWDLNSFLEDYDLWLKLRFQNKKFYNCKQILVKHRIHKNSAFNSNGNNDKIHELFEKYKNYII